MILQRNHISDQRLWDSLQRNLGRRDKIGTSIMEHKAESVAHLFLTIKRALNE